MNDILAGDLFWLAIAAIIILTVILIRKLARAWMENTIRKEHEFQAGLNDLSFLNEAFWLDQKKK